MKILLAEDEPEIATGYRIMLEKRNHEVVITYNGEDCLKVYHDALRAIPASRISPFHAVVLDYRMPKKDGMEVAKEILAVNPHQRIIFASAYVRDTLVDSVKQLKQVVELIQKPFELSVLVNTIENMGNWAELEKINVKMRFSSYNVNDLTDKKVEEIIGQAIKILNVRAS